MTGFFIRRSRRWAARQPLSPGYNPEEEIGTKCRDPIADVQLDTPEILLPETLRSAACRSDNEWG